MVGSRLDNDAVHNPESYSGLDCHQAHVPQRLRRRELVKLLVKLLKAERVSKAISKATTDAES